jgi:hypothetical protein
VAGPAGSQAAAAAEAVTRLSRYASGSSIDSERLLEEQPETRTRTASAEAGTERNHHGSQAGLPAGKVRRTGTGPGARREERGSQSSGLNEPAARPSEPAARPSSISYLFHSTSLHSRVDPCCVKVCFDSASCFLIIPVLLFVTEPFCSPAAASDLSDPCGLPPAPEQPDATPRVTLTRVTLLAAPPQTLRRSLALLPSRSLTLQQLLAIS